MTPEVVVIITVTIIEHLIFQNTVQKFFMCTILFNPQQKLSDICIIPLLHIGKLRVRKIKQTSLYSKLHK